MKPLALQRLPRAGVPRLVRAVRLSMREDGHVALSPEQLYQRGVELSNGRRYSAAKRALAAATERTQDADLRARIAGTLAYVTAQTGDPARAESLCRDALTADGLSPATVAVLCGQLGTLLMHSGRLDEAAGWLDRGIENAEDPVAIANMRTNRGMVALERRDLDAATADFTSAAAEYARQAMPVYEARVRHNLGYTALLKGNLVRALEEMRVAFPVFSAESAISGAIGELDQAEVLRDAGLTTEAERTLERVARIFGAHGMRQARGEAEYNLARSLLTHDPVGAARVAGAAARRFEALGSESWTARARGIRLRAQLTDGHSLSTGARLSASGRVPTAAEVDATAADLDRLGFPAEATALRLSHQLWEARHDSSVELVETTNHWDRGLDKLDRRNTPIQVRLLADEVRAARAQAAGRPGEARRHAARGLDALTTWQLSFGSLDLQTSLAMHASGLMYEGIAAAVRSGRPEVLFEWSERARHLSQQVVPLRPPPDPELAADLAELRGLRAENPSGWLTSARGTALQDRARHRQWTSTGAAGLDERVTLAELRTALDGDTAFATYLYNGDRVTCLLVTSAGARVLDAGSWRQVQDALSGLLADLAVSASVRTGPMAAVVAQALDDRLAGLEHLLLREPLALIGDSRLVLTTPGVLAGVPWTMLPGLRGRPFTLATSATRWVRDRNRMPATGVGFAAGPAVARGDEEVATAASAWQEAQLLRGPDATVDAVAGLAGRVGTLHIAAHGRHAVDNPLFSGLELVDGALFGYDIDRIPEVPGTVVLSACEVGRSSVRWGEEAIGMTRTWLHAGSSCVVAAPVVVADDAACELLGAMHTGLATGLAPAEALARAVLDTGVVAPFQCHGSGF